MCRAQNRPTVPAVRKGSRRVDDVRTIANVSSIDSVGLVLLVVTSRGTWALKRPPRRVTTCKVFTHMYTTTPSLTRTQIKRASLTNLELPEHLLTA